MKYQETMPGPSSRVALEEEGNPRMYSSLPCLTLIKELSWTLTLVVQSEIWSHRQQQGVTQWMSVLQVYCLFPLYLPEEKRCWPASMGKSNSCGQLWQGRILSHIKVLPKPEDCGRSWFLAMLQMGLNQKSTILVNIVTFSILSDSQYIFTILQGGIIKDKNKIKVNSLTSFHVA